MMTFKTNGNIKTFYCISQLTAQDRIFLPCREHTTCGIAQKQHLFILHDYKCGIVSMRSFCLQ